MRLQSYKKYLLEGVEPEKLEDQNAKAYFIELSDTIQDDSICRELICSILDGLDTKDKTELFQFLTDLAPKLQELVNPGSLSTESRIRKYLTWYASTLVKERPELLFPAWACKRIGELYDFQN